MEYLFKHWNRLEKNLCSKYIILFLDYDGTLVPIVERPDEAIIFPRTKKLLERLAGAPCYKLAIISGRSLSDIKKMVNIRGVIYSGNHGLEIDGPQIKFQSPLSLQYKTALKKIKEDLNAKLCGIKGVFVEDKGLTLSVHYRLADIKYIPKIKTIFHESIILYLVKNKIKIRPGKKVFEIRPPREWDKGKVVLWLLARWKFTLGDKDSVSIYIGDDVTDEDAFKALKNRGLTIFVGKPKESYAQYYLKNTGEVTEFLKRTLELKKGVAGCRN